MAVVGGASPATATLAVAEEESCKWYDIMERLMPFYLQPQIYIRGFVRPSIRLGFVKNERN